jgi:tRNA (Thr-GGU) A37 N-methylase
VTRSVVMQVVGSSKTEASQKSVPLDPVLARTLRTWRDHTKYKAASDGVFASPLQQRPEAVLGAIAKLVDSLLASHLFQNWNQTMQYLASTAQCE